MDRRNNPLKLTYINLVTDKELLRHIRKAQAGDSEAFAFIYDAYSGKLFRYLRIKVQSQQQAEDLLQETLVKIWRGLPGFNPDKGTFNAWAYRVAANTLNDFLRKVYRAPEALEMSEGVEYAAAAWQTESPSHEKRLDLELSLEELKSQMTGLPAAYRLVLEYRFLQDLTVEETAEVMSKSSLAIRLLQHRAVKKLKILNKQRKEDV